MVLRGAVDLDTADRWFAALIDEVPWRQDHIVIAGRRHRVPRLQAWIADAGVRYTYSNIALSPMPWTPTLRETRALVEGAASTPFNSVLVNRYRNGADSVAWHADDEPELGPAPIIGSLSLGATRTLQLRRCADPHDRRAVVLHGGDVAVMRPPTQQGWHHRVPKTTVPVGERINLTFRTVFGR